jgi:chromosome segregation ATPase
MDRIKDIEN